MKPEEIKNEKLEQELSEEELEGATGGAELKGDQLLLDGGAEQFNTQTGGHILDK